jgi:hypothetical protein
MSISSQGGDQQRDPSVVTTGKKATAGAKPAAAGKGPNRPGGKGGNGKGRRPVTPVKVNQSRPWGPIALFAAVGLLAVGIIGYGAWASFKGARSWQDRAADIAGIVNYRDNPDKSLTARDHKQGPLTYKIAPPVGGAHNSDWQNCMGDVYDAPIANEHAVHSLEHGAVWITYRTGLPADQVKKLADRVNGTEFTLMSPVDNLDRPVSLQAWGYQLKLDSVDDKRIDEFMKALRQNATVEPGVACSGGITATGTAPRDLPPQQQPADTPQQPGS